MNTAKIYSVSMQVKKHASTPIHRQLSDSLDIQFYQKAFTQSYHLVYNRVFSPYWNQQVSYFYTL